MTTSLSARRLAAIVGVSYRQLDYWARTELLRPSLSEARGSGTQRRYSLEDARVALGIRKGLDAGISLQAMRRATGYLRDPEDCPEYTDNHGGTGARLTNPTARRGGHFAASTPSYLHRCNYPRRRAKCLNRQSS